MHPSPAKRVLVVENDKPLLTAFKKFLEREHYEAIGETCAEAALERLQHETFDTLITDVELRGASGIQLMREAKRLQPALPIILITGNPESIPDEAWGSRGAFAIFLKPFDLSKLRSALSNCLSDSPVSLQT